jgi:hypothetical protein
MTDDDPFEDLDVLDRLFSADTTCENAQQIRHGKRRAKQSLLRAQSRPSWKNSLSKIKPRKVTLPPT